MKLSILDQSPIASNKTSKEALNDSLLLAQVGEKLGYTRYWISEHHDLSGLACSAPEVVLSYIGAQTNRIRIGPGAVLLPHYKPYKVAEVYHTLATLFPGRIDIGLGRAPGGSAEATNALSDNFLQNVYKMRDLVKELLHFLDGNFPMGHEFAKISAAPVPEVSPEPWLLGTSKKSALLAAENGLSYTFGQFMSEKDGVSIVEDYINAFKPRKEGQVPKVIVTVSAICAETTERANDIAMSACVWAIQREKGEGAEGIPSVEEAKRYKLNEREEESLEKMRQNMIIGNPQEVKQQLVNIKEKYKADEIMINTITYSMEDRIKSYTMIASEWMED